MGCKERVIEHQEPRDDEPTQQRTPDARNHQIGLSVQIVLSDPYIANCVWIDLLAKQPYRFCCKHYLYKISSSYKVCRPRERATDHQHDEPESKTPQHNGNS